MTDPTQWRHRGIARYAPFTAAVMPDRQLSVPAALHPWAWCVVFTATFAGIFVAVAENLSLPRPAAFYQFNEPRVAAFARAIAADPGKKRIVMLGNSQLKYGTELPDDSSSLSRPTALQQMHILRLTSNIAVMQDFRPFAEEILALHPDVIVLQLQLAALERRVPYSRLYALREYLKGLAFGIGPWGRDDDTQFRQQYDKPCPGALSKRETMARINRYRRITLADVTGPNAAYARWFIGAATGQGIRVVLVAIPATAALDAAIPMWNPVIVNDVIAHFGNDPKVLLMRYPERMDDSVFCDSMHLGSIGRAKFSDWIAKALQ